MIEKTEAAVVTFAIVCITCLIAFGVRECNNTQRACLQAGHTPLECGRLR